MKETYIFTSERLGFRDWKSIDFCFLKRMNSDPDVMKYFPSLLNEEQTEKMYDRLKRSFRNNSYTYFVVEQLSDNKAIGFIGLMHQNFESDYTPCVDIGWRLEKAHWGKGFAKEGAIACLIYAFVDLGLDQIHAFAPKVNIPSIRVMEKIGMKKKGYIKHPKLKKYRWLEECVCYSILKAEFLSTYEN